MVSAQRRAAVIGTGLIGGSIGLALRSAGWHVTGVDNEPGRAEEARERGALDRVGNDPTAEITFVATPVGATVAVVTETLKATAGVVTDVGSVKLPIVSGVASPRFVGGHPMAGSEQVGVEAARADLFNGAVWVLTPDDRTDDASFVTVRHVIGAFGADVVSVPAARHDELVAVVSHVPHLTAGALMQLADERGVEHQVLLRLAAGGFRDMTRIASGDPAIWPDICVENSEAIATSLDLLIDRLTDMRRMVLDHDRQALLGSLEAARAARQNLPVAGARPSSLSAVRVPIADKPGMLAEITTLATDLGINIVDIEIAHSGEGRAGVVIMLVEIERVDDFRVGLEDLGFSSSARPLE